MYVCIHIYSFGNAAALDMLSFFRSWSHFCFYLLRFPSACFCFLCVGRQVSSSIRVEDLLRGDLFVVDSHFSTMTIVTWFPWRDTCFGSRHVCALVCGWETEQEDVARGCHVTARGRSKRMEQEDAMWYVCQQEDVARGCHVLLHHTYHICVSARGCSHVICVSASVDMSYVCQQVLHTSSCVCLWKGEKERNKGQKRGGHTPCLVFVFLGQISWTKPCSTHLAATVKEVK